MDEFKSFVKEYVNLESKLKEHNAKIKEIKESKMKFEELIKVYMIEHDIDLCNLQNGDALILKKQNQLGGINKEYIHDNLVEFFKKPNPKDATSLAEKATEFLMSNREAKEKCVLKIQKAKK